MSAGIAMASGFVIPNSIVHYSNLSISNSQSSATVKGLQIMIPFNALAYQTYESNSLNNIEFFYTNNGTVVPSWMEGNQLDWYQPANTLYTSQNVIFWIKYAPSISAGSSAVNTVAIGFASKTVNLLDNVDTGEAPQLSCSNPANTITCNYGRYDDGSNVFNNYWNFSSNNTWYKGGPGYGPAGIEYADNGMRVQGWTFDNVKGITAVGNIITTLVNATGYSGTTWGGALILSNSSGGNGFGDYPGVGSITGVYTYSPVINLYHGQYFTHLQLGSNITDLNAPHTVSIGFNSSGEINYTSINYGSSMGSETSNMLALFPTGYYNQGAYGTGMLACTNFTIASAHAEITTIKIECSGRFSNNGILYAGEGADGCGGVSSAGGNGENCIGSIGSFGGSGGAGGGNATLGLIGGYGGNTLANGGIGSTGAGGNGAAARAPSVIDAANVALWGGSPSTYLSSGGGGGAANAGGAGEGSSQGLFIEGKAVNAGNVIARPGFNVGSGSGGAGAGALLIAYGNGGYTPGTYNLSGSSGGAAGSGWAAGGNGGGGQLITYDYGSNSVPVNVIFPKQTTTYPILASYQGNASYYYLYSRYMPPLGRMPSVSFSSAHITPSCSAFITDPSNSVVDVGQYESFTVSEGNCTAPYTYNILVSSSAKPSVTIHDYLVTGSSSRSIVYSFQTNTLDQSNSPEVANVIVTSGSNSVVSAYSSSFYVNPPLSFVSLSSSPTLPVTEYTGNAVKFTANISGGSAPYSYNFLIYNITTGSIVGNYLASNSSTSNTVSWQIPYSVGNNALEVNVIVSDGSYGGAEKVNSTYIKPLYTKSIVSVTNVFPDSCISNGGCAVTVSGAGFENGTSVIFGSNSVNAINVTNSSSMQVTVPAGTVNSIVDVSVKNQFGSTATWNGTFYYGWIFISDNFSTGNFNGWNETGSCCVTGGSLYVVSGGQTTFSNTLTPAPISGNTEAMIWYPFRQGIVDINSTKMTLVSGNPFSPGWDSNNGGSVYLGGYYGIVTNNASVLHWLYGSKFLTNGNWAGNNITIFEARKTIASVTNSISMTLTSSAGGNSGYFLADKWWEGLQQNIESCASSTECTLTSNVGIENNIPYISGTDDINNFFGQSFLNNGPTTMFVRGYVYFQAPTHGGVYGQRKVYYLKNECGGSSGLPCIGIAYILSSFVYNPEYGNVSINGNSVTLLSGDGFPTDGSWNGKGILINESTNYTIASVKNGTYLTLTSNAGRYTDVGYQSLANDIALTSDLQSNINPATGNLTDSDHYMAVPYLNFNQWYEIQVEAALNTPGEANGYVNVWINGKYRPDLSLSGIEWRNSSNDGGWQYVEIGRQLDAGNGTARTAWTNEYRFWDDVALSNADTPTPVQLQPINTTFKTTTTISVSSTSSTTTVGTTSPTTMPVTTVTSSGNSGGGGGGGAGGGGGSGEPVVLAYNTSSFNGWKILNFTQDNSENLVIDGRLFGITLNSISPTLVDITVNGVAYTLHVGTPLAIGSNYYLNLSSISYLPILETASIELYVNNTASKTVSSSNSSSQNYNVSISLNGSSFASGSSQYITARVADPSDTVAIYTNGVLQAEGEGSATFNINVLSKGNYTLQACDISVSPRACSAIEKFSILAPSTAATTTISQVTTVGQTNTSSSTASETDDIVLMVVATIAIGTIIAFTLRYRRHMGKMRGNDGAGPEHGKLTYSSEQPKQVNRAEEPKETGPTPPDVIGQQNEDKPDESAAGTSAEPTGAKQD